MALPTRALLCSAALVLFGNGQAQPAPDIERAGIYRHGLDLTSYWVSEKLDGVRARWDGRRLISKRGNLFQAPEWFTAGWPAIALDGELWAGRGSFARVSGIVRRTRASDEEWRQVRFMVFDLPGSGLPFEARLARLRTLFAAPHPSHLQLIEQFRVVDQAQLLGILDKVVAGGGEGLMLHDGRAHYRSGRVDHLLKLKTFQDAEATVVAHLPGKGRYQGMLGALLVQRADGRRFRLGSGLSEAQRRQPPPLGTLVTYKYYGLTRSGLPRFASFLRVRDDEPAGHAIAQKPGRSSDRQRALRAVPQLPAPASRR